ncbi:MAG: hypothetical protein CMN94_11555 [Synechococcus sp. EAC657]|nr:hypothetical protein [Synechococcus sp. EAC657]
MNGLHGSGEAGRLAEILFKRLLIRQATSFPPGTRFILDLSPVFNNGSRSSARSGQGLSRDLRGAEIFKAMSRMLCWH